MRPRVVVFMGMRTSESISDGKFLSEGLLYADLAFRILNLGNNFHHRKDINGAGFLI